MLCAVAGTTPSAFTESTKLDEPPFRFTDEGKKALCVPLSKIAIRHGGSPMAQSETVICKTVGVLIDLTWTKANTPSRAVRRLPKAKTVTSRKRSIP